MSARRRARGAIFNNRSRSLRSLIALHRRASNRCALSDNLGDGYLYAKNAIYRRIRDVALAAGYRFTRRDVRGYLGFPLLSLDAILDTRKIPYRPNVAALEQVENCRPLFFSQEQFNHLRPVRNYLLHESAHAIAYHAFMGNPESAWTTLADPSRLVHVLGGEAFALTTEYLASCLANDVTHRWFLGMNSYRSSAQRAADFAWLIEELDFVPAVWMLYAAFLYNNWLVEQLTDKQFSRVLALCPTGRQTMKQSARRRAREALSEMMHVSTWFRMNTTPIFLAKFGHPVQRSLFRGDPLCLVERDETFGIGVLDLLEVLRRGLRAPVRSQPLQQYLRTARLHRSALAT